VVRFVLTGHGIHKAAFQIDVKSFIPSSPGTPKEGAKVITGVVLASGPREVGREGALARMGVLMEFPTGAVVAMTFARPILQIRFSDESHLGIDVSHPGMPQGRGFLVKGP
jgi:hypothetical protein